LYLIYTLDIKTFDIQKGYEKKMILLLYLLELATLFLVCKNVLHLRKTRSLGKLAVTFFVVIFWAFYIIFSQNTFPNTIALLIAVLFFYTEPWYFKCCLVVVYTLFVNIVSNLNIYLYCMIAQNDSVKNMNYLSLLGHSRFVIYYTYILYY